MGLVPARDLPMVMQGLLEVLVARVSYLIVDDDPDMRLLVRALAEVGDPTAVVTEADGADDAVRLWREQRPDVIVMDQQMPGQTGIEAARQILTEAPGQEIVLFSAYLTADDVAEATRIGVRECITKNDLPRLTRLLQGH